MRQVSQSKLEGNVSGAREVVNADCGTEGRENVRADLYRKVSNPSPRPVVEPASYSL